jgi:hypothetical protein
MPAIRISGVFNKIYSATDESKKAISDGIHSLLKMNGVKIDGKIRFSDDGAVTFAVANQADIDKVLPDLKRMPNADVKVVGSGWDLAIAARSAAMDAS